MKKNKFKFRKRYIFLGVFILLLIFGLWQFFLPATLTGNWQAHTAIMPTVKFENNLVTVHNVRNFRYISDEIANKIEYYDATYDLNKVESVWFAAEPFSEDSNAAHTFLSFGFADGKYLAITIEARKLVSQEYDVIKGFFRTYPLMYIASDERDAILVRANVRQHEVFLYPIATTPVKAKALLTDMLITMNSLASKPRWYNTITANCTSLIASHVNKISPHRLPFWSWQLLLTGHADELALKAKLLATDLPIDLARKKYNISERSRKIGDVPEYSKLIREFSK